MKLKHIPLLLLVSLQVTVTEPSVFGVPTVGAESLKRVYDNP